MNDSQLDVADLHTQLDALREDVARLNARLEAMRPSHDVSIVCFSGEWDRLFAAFVIANGSLALGQEVHLFFTFWAAAALRAGTRSRTEKEFLDRVLGGVLPAGPERAPLSKMNFFGLGKWFFRRRMRARGVPGLSELVLQARELGAHFHVCEMSTDLLGFDMADFGEAGSVEACGVATFMSTAVKSQVTLFI